MIVLRRCRSRRLFLTLFAVFIAIATVLKIATATRDDGNTEDREIDVRDETVSTDQSVTANSTTTRIAIVREILRKFISKRPDFNGDQRHIQAIDNSSEDDEQAVETEIEVEEGSHDKKSSATAMDRTSNNGEVPWAPKQFDYRQIFSLSSRDRKFIPIYFGGAQDAYNPNIIPHPTKADMWIVVAQHLQTDEHLETSEQLVCHAGFLNGVLLCAEEPKVLPVTRSIPGNCVGDLSYFNFRNGPRDARMFYGPDAPYLVYGSQSSYTCLGLWLHDVRMLLDAFRIERYMLVKYFKSATELRRLKPWRGIEKNYFIFWDPEGKAYAHYDLWPKRSFAQIDADGSVVGDNLATTTEIDDQICMAKFMPTVSRTQESIHQASNTLRVTMCRRADPGCVPNEKNTFLMHIFHHKTFYDFHGVYEPHVVLFKTTAPFAIHAISQRPFWIHGRAALTNKTDSQLYNGREDEIPEGHTELFYVTSISWRTHGQKYHGYIDDVLLIQFGIEDTRSGTIDVVVEDILQDLAVC